MTRTDRIWQHADAAFKEADKAFAEADRLFAEMPPDNTHHTKTGAIHELHFQGRNLRERRRLIVKFTKMAFGILFTGKTELRFKNR